MSGYLISRAASLPEKYFINLYSHFFNKSIRDWTSCFSLCGARLTSHNWVLKMTSDLRLKLYNVLEKMRFSLRQNIALGYL